MDLINAFTAFPVSRTANDVISEAQAGWDTSDAGNTKADTDTTFDVLTDVTGNGNHLTAISAGQRPTITTVNSLDAADWVPADSDGMRNTSPTAGLMNAFNSGGQMMMVVQIDGVGTFGRLFAKTDENEAMSHPGGAGTLRWFLDHATTDSIVSFSYSAGSLMVLEASIDKSLVDETDAVVTIDGSDVTVTSVQSPSGAATDLSGTDFYLGNRGTGNRPIEMIFCEAYFWNSKLSSGDKALMRAYFDAKWGTLAS